MLTFYYYNCSQKGQPSCLSIIKQQIKLERKCWLKLKEFLNIFNLYRLSTSSVKVQLSYLNFPIAAVHHAVSLALTKGKFVMNVKKNDSQTVEPWLHPSEKGSSNGEKCVKFVITSIHQTMCEKIKQRQAIMTQFSVFIFYPPQTLHLKLRPKGKKPGSTTGFSQPPCQTNDLRYENSNIYLGFFSRSSPFNTISTLFLQGNLQKSTQSLSSCSRQQNLLLLCQHQFDSQRVSIRSRVHSTICGCLPALGHFNPREALPAGFSFVTSLLH